MLAEELARFAVRMGRPATRTEHRRIVRLITEQAPEALDAFGRSTGDPVARAAWERAERGIR